MTNNSKVVPLYWGEGPDRVKVGTAMIKDGVLHATFLNDDHFTAPLDPLLKDYTPSKKVTDGERPLEASE